MNRLRLKTYFTIIPIVVATVMASGYVSFLESRLALTRLANRHLAYKAEQLRDYVNNEWEIVEGLGLSGDEEYQAAQRESFRSYAYSLLRSDTEEILVFDGSGALVFRIGGLRAVESSGNGARKVQSYAIPPGWFSREILGEERVGIAFAFEPFGWNVAVTELRSRYFSDVDGILRTNLLILIAAVLFASILSAAYLRHIISPLERLTRATERIAETGDLSLRAQAEYEDEIGILARRFNAMLETLQAQNIKLSEANQAEREAHATAVQREVETLFLLGRISDYNDSSTGAHLSRIGALSARFARLLGQDTDAEELIRNASPLHDIGKIAIPEAILNKPGKLSAEEFEAMKKHTSYGYDLLKGSQSRYLAEGAVIAHTHHERWDGSGYPKGLRGEAIPLSGRIVSVVDVFDALVSERPYKPAWGKDEALAYIIEQRAKCFDPMLVGLFCDHFPEFAEVWDGLRWADDERAGH
jgi:response regulator RpfG family c-di-GMP phosphodiesterase